METPIKEQSIVLCIKNNPTLKIYIPAQTASIIEQFKILLNKYPTKKLLNVTVPSYYNPETLLIFADILKDLSTIKNSSKASQSGLLPYFTQQLYIYIKNDLQQLLDLANLASFYQLDFLFEHLAELLFLQSIPIKKIYETNTHNKQLNDKLSKHIKQLQQQSDQIFQTLQKEKNKSVQAKNDLLLMIALYTKNKPQEENPQTLHHTSTTAPQAHESSTENVHPVPSINNCLDQFTITFKPFKSTIKSILIDRGIPPECGPPPPPCKTFNVSDSAIKYGIQERRDAKREGRRMNYSNAAERLMAEQKYYRNLNSDRADQRERWKEGTPSTYKETTTYYYGDKEISNLTESSIQNSLKTYLLDTIEINNKPIKTIQGIDKLDPKKLYANTQLTIAEKKSPISPYLPEIISVKILNNKFLTDIKDLHEIKKFPSLKELIIVNNPLIDSIADNLASSSLSSITIFDSNIATIKATSFKALPNLQKLLLCKNAISEIEPYAFTTLTQLKTLDLSNNKICCLSPDIFKGLENLEALNCSKNKIKSLNLDTFKYCTSLQYLTLANNDIVAAAPNTHKHSLSILNLNHNKFATIDLNQISAQNIKELTLEYNLLQSITLPKTTPIHCLTLTNNPLKTLSPLECAIDQIILPLSPSFLISCHRNDSLKHIRFLSKSFYKSTTLYNEVKYPKNLPTLGGDWDPYLTLEEFKKINKELPLIFAQYEDTDESKFALKSLFFKAQKNVLEGVSDHPALKLLRHLESTALMEN
ncbi:MAG: leucine-rich repeat domain-containing protein [Candidatus Babeliales bacterium]